MFQQVVNQTQAFGVVGEVFNNGPIRSAPATIVSSDPLQNIVGRAFTLTTGAIAAPQPTDASIVQAGGTGTFAGILVAPKTYASSGANGDPLAPTLQLANQTIGEFLTMGEILVNIPNPANIGDFVTYNTLTGSLDTVAPTVTFTGIIAVTTGILTASAVTGEIYVGMPISGTGVPAGTIINGLGTGTGGAGTYDTNIVTAVASTTMTGPAQPQQATSFTGVIAATTGILTASAITAGAITPGMSITGTNVPAGTIVVAQLTGTPEGAGTYSTNITTAVASTTMTSPAYAFVPEARVSRYTVPAGGLAVIALTGKYTV